MSSLPHMSSLRKQGPIRRALSIGCGVWVPALRPFHGPGRDDFGLRHGGCSFLPSRKGLRERALTGRALLHGENRAPVVGVDNRDVEPGPLLQELDIAL